MRLFNNDPQRVVYSLSLYGWVSNRQSGKSSIAGKKKKRCVCIVVENDLSGSKGVITFGLVVKRGILMNKFQFIIIIVVLEEPILVGSGQRLRGLTPITLV